jgi:chromate transporter
MATSYNAWNPLGTQLSMTSNSPPIQRPSLAALIKQFLLLGATSFGGATFVYFYSEFVDRLKWLGHDEIMNYRSLSQLLPGANVGDLAVLVGRRLHGARGAAAALLAITLPGAGLMLLLSALYFRTGHVAIVTSIFKGVGPAAAGLALGNALEAAGREARRPRSVWLVPLTLISVVLFRPPTILVFVLLGTIGALIYRPRAGDLATTTPEDRS